MADATAREREQAEVNATIAETITRIEREANAHKAAGGVCDFCSRPGIMSTFEVDAGIVQTTYVETRSGASGSLTNVDEDGLWASCAGCAKIVRARNLRALVDRAMTGGIPVVPTAVHETREAMVALFEQFFASNPREVSPEIPPDHRRVTSFHAPQLVSLMERVRTENGRTYVEDVRPEEVQGALRQLRRIKRWAASPFVFVEVDVLRWIDGNIELLRAALADHDRDEMPSPLCSRCGKRQRKFDDLCGRCADEVGVRPRGKVGG